MLTLVLAMFCTMPSNAERTEILRDAMVLEGFTKAESMRLSESDMLDMAAEYGFDIEHSNASYADSELLTSVHECY